MRRRGRALVWRSARFALLHALIVWWWHVVAGPVDIGSRLTVSIVGGVLSAVLGGLWLGAQVAERLRAWAASRAAMPATPWAVLRRDVYDCAAPMIVAGGAGYAAAVAWSAWTNATVAQVTLAHGALVATAVAASGVGLWLESLLHARRLALAYGAALWLAPLTAFVWAPRVVAHGHDALERAVWVNPAAGVLSGMGRQNIFHSAALYTSLPYADYGVGLPNVAASIGGWVALGGVLLIARGLAVRGSWASVR